MDITFYKNLSPPETVQKNIQEVVSYYFTWKPSSSIISPVITIDTSIDPFIITERGEQIITQDGVNLVTIPLSFNVDNFKLLECNYAYIRQFGRYYYITNLTSVRNNLWEVELQVDVLMSFKNNILNLSGIIARNEFEFNELLVDDLVPSENTHSVYFNLFSPFKSKISVGDIIKEYEWDFSSIHFITVNMTYADNVYGGVYASSFSPNITGLALPYFFKNEVQVEKMLGNILTPTFWESIGDAFVNHSDYWSAFYAVPLNLYDAHIALNTDPDDINISPIGLLISRPSSEGTSLEYTSIKSVFFGGTEVSIGNPASEITYTGIVRSTSRIKMWSAISDLSSQFEINSFIDTTPYSRYLLYLPFIGTVEIPSERIQRGVRYIVYDVDVATGSFLATLSNYEPTYYEPANSQLDCWEGNMYLELPKGSSNRAELHRNSLLAVGSLVSDVIGGAMDISKGFTMRTPKRKKVSKKGAKLIEKGASDIFGDIFESTLTFATNFVPTGSTTGISDGLLRYKQPLVPYLLKIQSDFYYPDNYNHEFGRPLQEERILSDLHGFTSLSAVHLENFGTATLDELSEIEDLLLQGVILPN